MWTLEMWSILLALQLLLGSDCSPNRLGHGVLAGGLVVSYLKFKLNIFI